MKQSAFYHSVYGEESCLAVTCPDDPHKKTAAPIEFGGGGFKPSRDDEPMCTGLTTQQGF